MCEFICVRVPISKGEFKYLLFHDHAGDSCLYHISPVQAIHAVNSEDAFLLTDDSCLVHPICKSKMDITLDIILTNSQAELGLKSK